MNLYDELQAIQNKIEDQNKRINLVLSEIRFMQMILTRVTNEKKVDKVETRRNQKPNGPQAIEKPKDGLGGIEEPFGSNRYKHRD